VISIRPLPGVRVVVGLGGVSWVSWVDGMSERT
jgi:hypothetical protein